jgi:archaellum component FlaC
VVENPYWFPQGGSGGSGSVTSANFVSLQAKVDAVSNAVSIVSAATASVDARIDSVSNAVSTEVASRTSADNALSAAIAALSNSLSLVHDGLILNEVSADTSAAPTSAVKIYATDENGISRTFIVDADGRRIQISRDQTLVVRNGNAGNIVAGQAVYLASATGGFIKVDLAKADSLSAMAAIGIVRDAVISANAFGVIITEGVLSINTATYTDGDKLYVDTSSAGGLTNVKPTYPNYPQQVGTVMNAGVNGGLFVHIEEVDILDNISALSNSISVLNQQVSALSARVDANSAQMASANDAISNAVSIVSVAAANALSNVNAVSQALSVETASRVSAVNIVSNAVSIVSVAAANALSVANAASNAVSVETANRISAVNVVSNSLSVEIANRISAVNAVSNAVSIVSVVAANATSIANAASNAASIVSAAVVSVSAALESHINTVSNAVSLVSVVAANALSVANAASNAASVVSAAQAATSAAVTSVNNRISAVSTDLTSFKASLDNFGDVSATGATSGQVLTFISGQWTAQTPTAGSGSVTSAELSAAVAALSNSISVVSAATALKNPIVTVQEEGSNVASSPTIINFRGPGVSVKTSAGVVIVSVATGGGGGSVTSANFASLQSVVQANSAQMTSADNAISNAVSIVSVAQAATSAAVTSVNNRVSAISTDVTSIHDTLSDVVSDLAVLSVNVSALSTRLSALSSQVNTNSAQMTSADNAISNAVSVLSVVVSNEISARTAASAALESHINTVSNAVSVLSAAFSNQLSIISVAIDGLSNRVSVLSVNVDTLSNNVSALSAAIVVLSNQVSAAGGFQQKVVQGTQSISTSALTQISGLSVSVAANGAYKIEAYLIYNVSAISASGYNLALVASGLTQQTANGNWQFTSAQPVSTGGTAIALVNQPFNGLSGAAISVTSAGTAQLTFSKLEAIVVASTTGGTLVIQGKTTVASNSLYIYKGSYIKAFKII